MQTLAKLTQEHHLTKLVLVTNQFHLPRAMYFAKHFGLQVTPWAAEAVISREDPDKVEELTKLYLTPKMKKLYRTETLALIETFIDPAGWMPTAIKMLTLP